MIYHTLLCFKSHNEATSFICVFIYWLKQINSTKSLIAQRDVNKYIQMRNTLFNLVDIASKGQSSFLISS